MPISLYLLLPPPLHNIFSDNACVSWSRATALPARPPIVACTLDSAPIFESRKDSSSVVQATPNTPLAFQARTDRAA